MPSPRPPLASAGPDRALRRSARRLSELEARQPLNQATRAVHAAAWCGRDGKIVLVREDVGRHNALDKTIGALARAGVAPDSGFFVITSRCSFEMVAKAAIFGAGTLVSVSAPTSLALERAQRFRRSRDRCRAPRSGFVLRGREGRSKRRIGGLTTGKLDKLVRMANQIGDFYASMPEREATEGAASHLRLYWTPKMIREIIAFADEGHSGLNAIAARAVEFVETERVGRLELRRALMPRWPRPPNLRGFLSASTSSTA